MVESEVAESLQLGRVDVLFAFHELQSFFIELLHIFFGLRTVGDVDGSAEQSGLVSIWRVFLQNFREDLVATFNVLGFLFRRDAGLLAGGEVLLTETEAV